MINSYPDGHYLIAQDVFNKSKKSMVNVMNHGQMVNEVITYINQEGKQVKKNVCDIVKNSTFIFPIAELDIKDSLFYWFRKNYHHFHKKLVPKDNLTNGEIFKMDGWAYGIMLAYDDENIYYKIKIK